MMMRATWRKYGRLALCKAAQQELHGKQKQLFLISELYGRDITEVARTSGLSLRETQGIVNEAIEIVRAKLEAQYARSRHLR